jgi:5'-3' exoribonuclease 1
MGIKHFFQWFRRHHTECIETIPVHTPLTEINVEIDTLALDLNGIFHPAAQKVFQYGAHAPLKRFLTSPSSSRRSRRPTTRDAAREVCRIIDQLVHEIRPRKRLFLCVDGVAGNSKMAQQRQRRFRAAQTRSESSHSFDSCSITPGTAFMHELTGYIDWHVKQQISSQYPEWSGLQVLFSNEKVPGEGEHKALAWMRTQCDPSETVCIHGMDADLVMLMLALNRPHVYIVRDDPYRPSVKHILNIGRFADRIRNQLQTPSAIPDFILLCFMVGNDFLPSTPGLEIFNHGIESLLDVYRVTCTPMGLVDMTQWTIHFDRFQHYLSQLAPLEQDALERKYLNRTQYHPDSLMLTYFTEFPASSSSSSPRVQVDYEAYQEAYYKAHFDEQVTRKQIVYEYMHGLEWILHYYMNGIPSWTWCYPYLYAPFITDLASIRIDQSIPFDPSEPSDPYLQLLCVLPPQSASLLPDCLSKLMTQPYSPLVQYYPETVQVDLSGKRAEWEGIVLLPTIPYPLVQQYYIPARSLLSPHDQRRNQRRRPIRYEQCEPYSYSCRWGTLPHCLVRPRSIEN